uniref:Uncharacterized protein n=1 Tax=Ditylenchus dipsaci TaxID=166011 RepID=A0A915E0G5_9BILA
MTMPDSARQTLDEMRFLFWDSREQEPGMTIVFFEPIYLFSHLDNTTILIWMSENQEKLLEETEFLSFDATYKKSPRGFYQLFYIYGRLDRKVLPIAWVWMQKKTRAEYLRVWYVMFNKPVGDYNIRFAMAVKFLMINLITLITF